MIQQNKKGFSLVEVMLLFTVLAVILSASIPVVSRKSNPIPNKVNHGVYRCIATENGLLEELYTGTRRVKPDGGDGIVQECTFRVPNAALYRIDMYSAGAGGTKAAVMHAENNDNRLAYFNSNATYSGFSSENPNAPSGQTSLLRNLTNAEIEDAFTGEYLVRSVYSGDAGSGGTASFKAYTAPTASVCEGFLDAVSAKTSELSSAIGYYTEGSSNYSQDLANYQAIISEQERLEKQWQELKDEINGYKEEYDKLTDSYYKILELMTEMKQSSPSYTKIKTGCTETFYTGTAPEVSIESEFYSMRDSLADIAAGWAIDDATSARDDAYKTYKDVTYPALIAEIVQKAKEEAEEAEEEFDEEEATKKAKKDNPMIASGNEPYRIQDFFDDENYAAPYASGGRSGLANYIAGNDDDACHSALQSNKSMLSGVYNEANNIKNEIEAKMVPLEAKQNEYKNDGYGNTFEQQITYAGNNEKAAKDLKDGAKTNFDNTKNTLVEEAKYVEKQLNQIKEGNLSNIIKNHGYADSNTFDNPNSVESGNTYRQLRDYCANVYGIYGSSEVHYDTKSKTELGQSGGRGKYLVISYPITFKPITGNEESFDVKTYLAAIQTPGNPEGFWTERCSDKSGKYGDNCNRSYSGPSSLTGLSKQNVHYANQRFDTEVFEYNSPDRHFKTGDGKDLKKSEEAPYPYVGWSIPHYVGGVPIGSDRKVVTLVDNEPTGGERGKMYVREENTNGEYIPKNIQNPQELTASEIAGIVFDNNYAYNIETQNGTAGTDTTFHGSEHHQIYNDIPTTFADVYSLAGSSSSKSNPLFRDIKIKIASSLWSKRYEIGQSGTRGKFSTFLSGNLGSNCTFDIPRGGAMYDPYSGQSLSELESRLSVSVTCYAKEGDVVFNRSLSGGKYNPELIDSPVKFFWHQGIGSLTMTAEPPENKLWRPTSIWAKAYENFMGGYSNYDLNDFNIGKAGDGTTLVDSCTVPKGYYDTQKQIIYKYGSGAVLTEETETEAKTPPIIFNGTLADGTDCYGYPGEEDLFADQIITDDDRGYSVTAGHGGGGAVVITW